MDRERFLQRQEDDFRRYEALCKQCGQCCGAFGDDPCEHLQKQEDGKYRCKVYDERLGLQRTASGNIFICIRIRDAHSQGIFYNNCGYSK